MIIIKEFRNGQWRTRSCSRRSCDPRALLGTPQNLQIRGTMVLVGAATPPRTAEDWEKLTQE